MGSPILYTPLISATLRHYYCAAPFGALLVAVTLVYRPLLYEPELELIQSHMAQKPVLRGEVGCACVAREVSVERGGMGRGCARRLGGWVWV